MVATLTGARHKAAPLSLHVRSALLVMLGAAVISGLVGEVTDTLVILVIVVLNAVIGFVQAWRADQAMAALRLLAAAQCRSSPPQSWCPATSP